MDQSFYNSTYSSEPILPWSPFISSVFFLAFLHSHGYAPTTIHTYISAIGYIHKFLGFPSPSTQLLTRKTLDPVGHKSQPLPHKLSITLPTPQNPWYSPFHYTSICDPAHNPYLSWGATMLLCCTVDSSSRGLVVPPSYLNSEDHRLVHSQSHRSRR